MLSAKVDDRESVSAAVPAGLASRLRRVIFRIFSAAEHTCTERRKPRAHLEVIKPHQANKGRHVGTISCGKA